MSLDIAGDVLTINFPSGETAKVKVPRGERGPAGRDGMSIRGDKGEQGDKGETGRDGRDSTVPGPKGEKGETGNVGKTPVLKIGRVITGEEAAAFIEGPPEEPVLNLVLPRGERGGVGASGKDGKHGSHEFAEVLSAGSSPLFHDEMLARYVIADGVIALPESLGEDKFGAWIHVKTLDALVLNNCLEGAVRLAKNESAKMVVVPYQGKFVFTRF